MRGQDVRAFRERHGLTQAQLAELLNGPLERNYAKGEVGRWENDRRPVPQVVSTFIEGLEIAQTEEALAGLFGGDEKATEAPDQPLGFQPPPVEESGDTAPPPPPGSAAPFPVLSGDPALARICTELWEMVATGVGLVGAATHSEALKNDGMIIDSQKEALGKAWGKLAETNQTLRRMLLGATSSGAVLEVALVTAVTFGKCARNHQAINEERKAAQARAAYEAQEDGRGGEVPGYPAAA